MVRERIKRETGLPGIEVNHKNQYWFLLCSSFEFHAFQFQELLMSILYILGPRQVFGKWKLSKIQLLCTSNQTNGEENHMNIEMFFSVKNAIITLVGINDSTWRLREASKCQLVDQVFKDKKNSCFHWKRWGWPSLYFIT